MTERRYRLSFTAGGLLVREASVAASLYLRLGDWAKVRAALESENLLQARTVSSGQRLAREVVQRLAVLTDSLEHAERSNTAKEADRLRKVLSELDEYEHDTLYPLASQNIVIDLDDGVKANYPKFGNALKKIPSLDASE